jgi:signal transduction histidine kinase
MMNSPNDLTVECLVHDLNNVFQTLVEAADLLSTDPKWVALAGTIFRSVERGKGITDSLSHTEPELVDLNAAIEKSAQFAEDFIATALAGRVKLSRDLLPGVRVQGTPSVWERVFVNLFLNAAQAMPKGGAVQIHTKVDGGHVQIVVTDDGPGIPAAILSEIFKPRFSTSARRSGLGLHIVATIVNRHHGTVQAANREDSSGAVFTISLPCEVPVGEVPMTLAHVATA